VLKILTHNQQALFSMKTLSSILLFTLLILDPAFAAGKQTLPALDKPIPAPDFNLKGEDGKSYRLSDMRGKVVVINFWATWCPPCREEIPLFLSLRKKYSAAGFEIVGISVDDVSKVMQYRDAMHIDYPLLNGQQQGMSLMASLGNRTGGLPYSVIFDRNGNVIDLKSGAYKQQELVKLIENHL
jgi:peroxiredoxin